MFWRLACIVPALGLRTPSHRRDLYAKAYLDPPKTSPSWRWHGWYRRPRLGCWCVAQARSCTHATSEVSTSTTSIPPIGGVGVVNRWSALGDPCSSAPPQINERRPVVSERTNGDASPPSEFHGVPSGLWVCPVFQLHTKHPTRFAKITAPMVPLCLASKLSALLLME